MRRRTLAGAAILAIIATLGVVASASGGILIGTYEGRITGVEGIGNFGFKGGNMKFKLSGQGRIKSFQFSRIRVLCSDGNTYRTSGHIAPNVRVRQVNGVRKFVFGAQNSAGAVFKAKGIFRGSDHARGFLRFKGTMSTTGGTRNCTTFRQLWSARHVG
jgi:hypothetical protein